MTNPELSTGAEWDLAEVLSEVQQPETSVSVYLDVAAAYNIGVTEEKLSKATGAEAKKLEKELAEHKAVRENSKYTFHLIGVPERMREDIRSKAMHEHPRVVNLLGQETDADSSSKRDLLNTHMIWQAQVKNVVNPSGASKTQWTIEEMGAFYDKLSNGARNEVNQAIVHLAELVNRFSVESKSVDF